MVFFPPTDRETIFEFFLGQKLCLLLSSGPPPLFLSLERFNPRHFTHWEASAANLHIHMHICTHEPQNSCTNIVQVHPQERYWNMYTVFTQTHMHPQVHKHTLGQNICDFSVKAIASFWECIYLTFSCMKNEKTKQTRSSCCAISSSAYNYNFAYCTDSWTEARQ